ncbi:MAG TPA: PH domain-containing protein [Terriglobales bacterium]|nr:PH domain-containing protein [Terriglobales bacterium]
MQSPNGIVKIKPSIVPFVWKGVLLILLGLVMYVGALVISLPFSLPMLSVQVGALVLAVVGILAALVGLVKRNTFTYMITDQAVIVQRQLLRRSVRRIPFASISDMEVAQSFVGRILGYGNIAPVTKSGYGLVRGMDRSENMVAEMTNVPRPDRVADLILSRVSAAPKLAVTQ